MYQGDVRDLLRTLIESFGETTYPPKVNEKVVDPLSLSFLLGLADIPEQYGDKAFVMHDIDQIIQNKVHTDGIMSEKQIGRLNELKKQISQLEHKKCVITIELSQNSNGILFEVTKYPRISHKEFSYTYQWYDYKAIFGAHYKDLKRAIYYPILIVDADATPLTGIDFMNWKQPPLVQYELYSIFSHRVGKNKFSIKDKTIEEFVKMMEQPRKLQLREEGPKIVVVDSQPQPSATPAPGAGAAEPEAAEPVPAPAPVTVGDNGD